ncbi:MULTISPECIES: hypothetical protein [Amycolatopsis]|uniref:hypothetical protein n=1 Tax=Amycolatopsis TaxID=1813 RepID=UPI0011789FAB
MPVRQYGPGGDRELIAAGDFPQDLVGADYAGDPVPLRRADRHPQGHRHRHRHGKRLVADIWTALDEQTASVPDTTGADAVLPRLADSLKTAYQQRSQVTTEVEEILDAHTRAGS